MCQEPRFVASRCAQLFSLKLPVDLGIVHDGNRQTHMYQPRSRCPRTVRLRRVAHGQMSEMGLNLLKEILMHADGRSRWLTDVQHVEFLPIETRCIQQTSYWRVASTIPLSSSCCHRI